jgi:hypothetical protein
VEKRKDLFLDTTPEPANAALAEPATTAMMVDMMADVDEDAALAAALAMSAGDAGLDLAALGMGDIGGMGGMGDMGLGGMGGMAGMAGMGQENLEEQLLACRCLANLMEAMPGSAHTLVYHGAIPVSCNKLLHITFIDLAEQTISVCPFTPQYHSTNPPPADPRKTLRRIPLGDRPRRRPLGTSLLP